VNALLAHLDEFASETAAAAAEMSLEESVANLEREDVPSAPVLSPAQVVEHPQVKANESLEEVTHPVLGRMLRPRPPARFSESPAEVTRHAPPLGEHGDEVLAELGFSEAERAALRENGVTGH
jgi:crotonobetainyl-CoA:carnitine CoA-transferase CaiB-like acyl-CoA transferase